MTTGVEPTPLATAAPASIGPPEGARRGRLRVPIAWVLVVCFGGLVLAAAASVLLVSATSNYRNTFALLEGSAVLRLDTIETHIRDQLAPVETLGRVLAERIVAGTLAPGNPVQLRDMLLGALGALPQLTGISYTTPEGKSTAVGYWFGRDEEAYTVDRSGDSLMRPHLEIVRTAKTPVCVGSDHKFSICNDPKFLTLGLSLKAYRAALLALPTERDRCADVQMGDQDVVEALSGPGCLEGGAVEAVRGESSDAPQLGRYRPTGPGSGGRCARVFAPSAGGPQAGPLQGDHRRPS